MSARRATVYVVPSLLGQVPPERVLPQRTLEVLRSLSTFVVETPKAARAFLRSAHHPRPIAELSLAVLDEHTPDADVPALLQPALGGTDIGLVSDAGCPGVADPGARLVGEAHRRGLRVVPLVGPSAVLLALMASGLDGQRFAFRGYLPHQQAAREQALRALEQRMRAAGETQMFIETPYRNVAMIESAARSCSPDTLLVVAADLSADTEEIVRRPIAEWRRLDPRRFERRPAMFLLGRDQR